MQIQATVSGPASVFNDQCIVPYFRLYSLMGIYLLRKLLNISSYRVHDAKMQRQRGDVVKERSNDELSRIRASPKCS